MNRIRLKKFLSYQLLQDNFREERLQPDEEIVIPQDDLYTITWETNFGEQLTTRGNKPIPTSLPNGERLITSDADTSDAHENETDYISTRDNLNDVNDAAQRQNERLNDDVRKRIEATEAEKNEMSDWPDSAICPTNQEKILPDLSERQQMTQIFQKKVILLKSMQKIFQKRGIRFPCPKDLKAMIEMKS